MIPLKYCNIDIQTHTNIKREKGKDRAKREREIYIERIDLKTERPMEKICRKESV
jgi:hypothetical protein